MVQDTGAAKGPGGVRPLGLPQLIQVKIDERGWPVAIKLGRLWAPVTVENRWRVDDEWWRDRRVSRTYFRIQAENGQFLKAFQDLVRGKWFCHHS